jgi:catechol 2,3-dioxygenase-like lactoylglutathione lyase family enzyme
MIEVAHPAARHKIIGAGFRKFYGLLWKEEEMIKTSGIDHVVLHVNDVRRSKKFYAGILGMTAYREDDGQVFMHAGRQGVALFEKPGDVPLAAGHDLNHLAFNVASGTYETLKAELEMQGVEVSGRPGQERCIYFRDPDGHRLQLMLPS